MSLETGQNLLHYRLSEKIGEGGMGTVWQAVDTTLDRQVAIKILPADFAEDADRRARFAREAKLLASLNHPNVASIFGIHEQHGIHFLAMELIAGEDLQQRLTRGALPVEEAAKIALQIAQAFEAAHANGIIHRDLKPANVKLTGDGGVKVLDFGLAKVMAPDTGTDSASASLSPTLTSAGTRVGMILGTAAYMSPEQAKGKSVDRRVDIWSFGVVLFELLAGRRMFQGDSVSETMAAVLMKDPDWAALPPATPARLRSLLTRCLDRDPKNRLQDIGEARIALQQVLAGDTDTAEPDDDASVPRQSVRRALPWIAVAVLAGFTLGWLAVGLKTAPQAGPKDDPVLRFSVQGDSKIDAIYSPAPAPDDRFVVYQGDGPGRSILHLHDFETGEVRPLKGSEGGRIPFISPDGRWVAFRRGTELLKLRTTGGDAIRICELPSDVPGGTWGPDGTILFPWGWLQGVMRVSADGGEPVPLSTVDADAGEVGHWFPRLLPGGKHALFTVWNAATGLIDADVALLDVETGRHRKLFRGADSWYLPPGYIVYYRAGSYHAIAFDLDTLEVTGDPVPVLEGVTDPHPNGTERLGLAISNRGTLFYATRQRAPAARLAVVEPPAEPRPLPIRPHSMSSMSLSPDGRTVAAETLESGVLGIRLLGLERGTDERVELDGGNMDPVWRPDGSGFAFTTMRQGNFDIYYKDLRAGGTERPVRVTQTDESNLAWSSDGETVIAWMTESDGTTALKGFPLDTEGGATEIPLLDDSLSAVSVSPDGDWIAYARYTHGKNDIYVRPYPGPGPEVRISRDGGGRPAWSPDGDELYFVRGHGVIAVSYAIEGDRFQPGREEILFESPLLAPAIDSPLLVLGPRRFVVALVDEPLGVPDLEVVFNWSREVAERLAER